MTEQCLLRFALLVGVTLLARAADAGLIVVGQDKLYSAPGVQSVDFILDLTGADAGGIQVSNFQVRVELQGANVGADALITAVNNTTSGQAHPLSTRTVETARTAYGATFNLGDPFTISDGAGLMRVDVEFKAGALGDYQLLVLTGTEDTMFLNSLGAAVPFSTDNAALSAAPEPSSALLSVLAVGAVCVYLAVRQRGSFRSGSELRLAKACQR